MEQVTSEWSNNNNKCFFWKFLKSYEGTGKNQHLKKVFLATFCSKNISKKLIIVPKLHIFRNLSYCAGLDDDGSTQTDLISVIQSFGRMSKSEQVEYLQLYNKYTHSGLEIEKNNAQCTMYDFHNSTDTLKFWTEKRTINKTFLFFIWFWWNLVKL